MPIPRISLDTRTLPEVEQFAGWARHSDATALAPLQAGPFHAEATMWDLGGASLSDCRLDPFVSDRTPAHVAADGAEFVQLVALRAGAVTLETPGATWRCMAPDLFVRDYRQSSRATSTAIDAIVLYLPHAFLEQAAGPVDHQGPLPPGPEATLLGSTLVTAVRSLPDAAPSAASLIARALRDLFAAALTRIGRDATRAAGAGSERDERLTLARAYVAAQPPGGLSLPRMARDLGLSRSVLFGLFRVHGGVLAYDRQVRLRALYRALRDPADVRSIALLGEAHGFPDRPALVRSFRRSFGRTPSEVRRGAIPASDGTPAAQARALIARLH